MNNFNQIAGYQKEKTELLGLRSLLLNLDEFRRSGVRMPRGVLLYGAPGVGKTMMAKAIATDGISFVELRSADCTRSDAEAHVMAAFENARAKTPCILLIDELDKIAESNDRYHMEGNDRVMKVLLQELDGQKDNSGVLVIATCNSYDRLNPALLRSGRFDRIIEIESPTLSDRKEIISHYLSSISLPNSINVDYLAKITSGYSCSQLECIINEAGIMAMQDGSGGIDIKIIQKAMNRVAFKALEGHSTNKAELWKTAVHEAGHTVVAMKLSPGAITSATIIPQGKARGHIKLTIDEDISRSVDEVEADITIGVAGSAAEEIILGKRYLTSISDMRKVRHQLTNLIVGIGAYGIELAGLSHGRYLDIPVTSELNTKYDRIFAQKINEFYDTASRIIRENRSLVDLIARSLIERSTLSADELFDLADSLSPNRPPHPASPTAQIPQAIQTDTFPCNQISPAICADTFSAAKA